MPLPGGATRLDYQTIDPAAGRLYVAHLGDGTVHVISLNPLKVLRTIPDLSSVHGVAVAPDRHLLIAAASGTSQAVLIDENTLRVVARLPAGQTPDGIAYDPTDSRAYVSNEGSNAETVIDLANHTVLPSISLGGDAGNTMFDPFSGNIMVNVQSSGELVTINPATDKITNRTHLTGCDSNHGLYIDGPKRLAFVACEGNAALLVVNLTMHRVTARFTVGDTPDVLAFDEGLHRLYVASESGVVAVFDEQGTTLHQEGSAKLADGAHTVAVDQHTHRVYFPLENVNGRPVLRVMAPTK